jgi:hypothetical protein
MKRVLLVIILVLCSCSKKSDDGSGEAAAVPSPDKAGLTAPVSNSTCTTGRVISATQSAVLFTWTTATNTNSYDLIVKNLLTGVSTTQTTTAIQFEVTLLRNTPYSWYVVSKSNKTTVTTQSDLFKFYNSGVASIFYAPFPADITSPKFAQSVSAIAGKVTLTWNGADVDNDIVGYDVYAGTSLSNMVVVKTNLTATTFDFAVTSGTVYYWKIITKDSQANTSASDVYQFMVN